MQYTNLEENAKATVLRGQSGNPDFRIRNERGTRSMTREQVQSLESEFLAIDCGKATVDRILPDGWAYLESINGMSIGDGKLLILINGQRSGFGPCPLCGYWSDGSKIVHDYAQIRSDLRSSEMRRTLGGFGTSRMGGWVE